MDEREREPLHVANGKREKWREMAFAVIVMLKLSINSKVRIFYHKKKRTCMRL